MIPFKVQYEKLVKAYMENRVEPMNACACFVGNLLNENSSWTVFKDSLFNIVSDDELNEAANDLRPYTPREILQMEGLFMRTWRRYGENEDSLFKAFEVTLMLLRKIHESKGEVIDEYVFKKRALKKGVEV